MTGPKFQPGEIVNVVIKGVRVTGDQGPRHTLTIADEHGTHYVMPPQAAIERVAPREWPPCAGDLWRDRNGDVWYALLVDDDDAAGERYVLLRPGRTSKDTGVGANLADVLEWHGPMTLAHRESGESQ